MTLRQILCGLRGHEFEMVYTSTAMHQQCLCGVRTPGWSVGPDVLAAIPGTQPYWDQIHSDLMDAELEVHGGG